jgi:hypothetical protein
MSKFRAVLGGLAAVGILAVLGAGGIFVVSSMSDHGLAQRNRAATSAALCFACVDAQNAVNATASS